MCGFLVAISTEPLAHSEIEVLAREELNRRGPDAFGSWQGLSNDGEQSFSISMFHSRLSIVGGGEGNQPLITPKGAFVFNGEFYDFQSTGASSDTVALSDALEDTEASNLDRKDWMGCFCKVDPFSAEVQIGRCLSGQKPLYYFSSNNLFLIGSSEILISKVMYEILEQKPSVNIRLLKNLIQRKRLQDPLLGFYAGIKKWLPNTILNIAISDLFDEDKLNARIEDEFILRWGQLIGQPEVELNQHNIRESTENGFVSVSKVADEIKTGVFLSGGLDSAILAYLSSLQEQSQNYYTYENGTKSSELDDARETANHFGIKSLREVHPTKFPSFAGFLDAVNCLIEDAGCMPHSFSSLCFARLCHAASADGCKVVLTGQGADELFMGYRKYGFLTLISKNIPLRVRLRALYSSIFSAMHALFYGDTSWRRYLYLGNRNLRSEGSRLLNRLGANRLNSSRKQQVRDFIWDSLPDIFSYEDNIGLSYGLEVRVPFLSSKCVWPVFRTPVASLYNEKGAKGGLKDAFWRHLPDHLKRRKVKKGFVNEWPAYLYEWREEIFSYLSGSSLGLQNNLWSKKELQKMRRAVNRSKGSRYSDNVFKYIVIEVFLRRSV